VAERKTFRQRPREDSGASACDEAINTPPRGRRRSIGRCQRSIVCTDCDDYDSPDDGHLAISVLDERSRHVTATADAMAHPAAAAAV